MMLLDIRRRTPPVAAQYTADARDAQVIAPRSLGYTDPAVTDDADAEQAANDSNEALRLATILPRALLIFLRVLRAGNAALHLKRAMPLVEELDTLLTTLLTEHGEIHLRVAADGLYLGRDKVVETAPREDPALFRLFQHGVRQISLQPGLTREEIVGLCDVLTTDLSSLENVEEDVTTLLASREFASIHFVVVETFSEMGGGGGDDSRRSGDVAAIMAAAVRKTLTETPDAGSQSSSGGTIRFWAADVRFLEGKDLPQLLAALPKSATGVPGSTADDVEIAEFAAEFRGSLVHWLPWLPRAVVTTALTAAEDDLEGLCGILGDEMFECARRQGIGSIVREAEKIGVWLEKARGTPAGEAMRAAVVSPKMRALAVAAIGHADAATHTAALAILGALSPADLPMALRDVCARPACTERARAIALLVRRGAAGVAAATELIAGLEKDAAVSVLRSVRNAPLGDEVLALHRAAITHRDMVPRVHALAWFARHGEDHAAAALGEALRAAEAQVRVAVLYLLTHTQPAISRALVRSWFASPEYDKLALADKRLGALVLATVVGASAVQALRGIAGQNNLTMRARVDETRAAAVAALGLLDDRAWQTEIVKIAQSRLAGQALVAEANAVLAAWEQGTAPYADPMELLAHAARELGIAEATDGRASRTSMTVRESGEIAAARSSLLPFQPTSITQVSIAGVTAETRVSSVSAVSANTTAVDRTANTTAVDRTKETALHPHVIAEMLASYQYDPIPPMFTPRREEVDE